MSTSNAQPPRRLSLFDSVCIIVGIVIGSGIYQTTPDIAFFTESMLAFLSVWVLGGLIAFSGALVYAELATKYPQEGGDFYFLTRAFGRRTGLLFAWVEYWIIRPGNIGMMAFVFAEYGCEILKYAAREFPDSIGFGQFGITEATFIGPTAEMTLAATAAGVIILLNLLGVRAGKWTQNVLTVVKVGGLLLVASVGLFVAEAAPMTVTEAPQGGFRLALIFALFTYGGWNEISYVAAEVRRPKVNLVWALLLGVAGIMAIYLVVAFSFVRCLGIDGVASSKTVAKDVVQYATGAEAAALASFLICLSALGSINGMVFTGSRVYFAVGLNLSKLRWLGVWNRRFDAPIRAMLLQGAITLALIIGFGSYASGFDNLLRFVTPVYWFFAFMVGVSLFVLRFKDPPAEESFRVPLYPWTPIIFCISCAVLFEASFTYALSMQSTEAFWAIGLVIFGAVLCYRLPLQDKEVERLS